MAADIENLRIKDERLARVLEGRGFLVFDGGLGTMIQKAGLDGAVNPPDLLNLTNPDAIEAIARAYVEAGSDVVTTNTFGSNARKLAGRASVAEVYAAAARIARSAGARYVAGDIGPTGALIEPLGDLSFEDAYDLFAEQARAADAAGCDLIIVETMADLREAKAAVLAAVENTDLPVFATMTFSESGRTFLGTTPAIAAATLSSMGVAAVGVNCSLGPDKLVDVVAEMSRFARCPVMAQPNAGLPRMVDGATLYDVEPEGFARSMGEIVSAGATIVGGCCGTSPAFIERLRALVDGAEPAPRAWERALTATSAQDMVAVSDDREGALLAGSLVEMAKDPELAEAMREGDYDDVASEASDQADEGARLIAVSAAVPLVDEAAALRGLVDELQGMVPLPLVIVSRDVSALEAAVRAYAGKPIVGPVDGASLDALIPLARKYGCGLVLSASGADKAFSSVEEWLDEVERLAISAERAGVPRCDIVVDCAAMAACADDCPDPRESARAISLCKQRLGASTMLSVPAVEAPVDFAEDLLAASLDAGLDVVVLDARCERYLAIAEDHGVDLA